MSKLRKWLDLGSISRLRTIIQLISLIILVYGGFAAISVSQNIPTFACPYNVRSGGTCYLISIQHQFHAEWNTFFTWRGLSILTGLFSFLLLFIILNKSWCGFICPLGTIQDWITRLRRFFKIPFSRYDQSSFKRLKIIKFIVLILLVLMPLFISNPVYKEYKLPEDLSAPYCQLCPARPVIPAMTGDFSQIVIDFKNTTTIIMTTLAMIILGLFLVGSFFKKRFFCFFCPMSALQHLFSKIGLLRLNKEAAKCTKCGNCARVCDVGIQAIADDLTHKFIVKDDCMMCFKCVEACPEVDCLKVKFLGLTLFRSTEEGFFKRYEKKNLDINNPKKIS